MLHHLSDRLFWDVNPALLDWEKDMPLIITRVVERGTLEEWRVIEQQYGLQKIVAAAKEIKSLNYIAANFLAQISGTPITEFRCYTTRQLHRQHWIY
ncbi:MAG: DUF6922 domain-containing protein [Lacibacter sp.]